MKMIKISEQEYERIKAAAKKNKNKRVDKKLQVLLMRHAGLTHEMKAKQKQDNHHHKSNDVFFWRQTFYLAYSSGR